MAPRNSNSRRRFLQYAGTAVATGLAGCGGGTGDGNGDGADGGDDTPQENGGDLGPVPDEYATATAQGGSERNPDSLATKQAVQYQSSPKEGEQCSDCRFYIPDKNGDGLGACSIVEGMIEPEGWCASYAPYEG